MELRKSLEIVNLQDENGYTVLHSAAYFNTFKIADFLITFFRKRLAQFLKRRETSKNHPVSSE
jgi:ankyrin repeat protein